ncbi:GxxExxY protein [Ramlibacter humi]|uniref:GxxExxY protein n=1 Tax=Ramlibacter humi TaxID=2530451 RepID=A0A4Z0BI89_9BURK|nr:GxxExxY protein [Ramlibacter humi]TFY97608.1 GxxExxY protein [Ramlibacter humi]
MEVDEITREVIGAAMDVHRAFGVGLLESAYAAALAHELELRGLRFAREVPIAATYKGISVGVGYRADFIVEDSIVLELKAVEVLLPTHRAQLLSYLRLADFKLGLLINFHDAPLTRGIRRVVNNL